MKKSIFLLLVQIIVIVLLYYFLRDIGQYVIHFTVLYWALACYIVNVTLIKKKPEIANTPIFVISILGLIFPFGTALPLIFYDDFLVVLFGISVILAILGYLVGYVLINIKERKRQIHFIFIAYFAVVIILLSFFHFWFIDLI